MQFEKDFTNEDLVEFEIENKKFKYKPSTAEDELNWADECMEIDEKGNPKQNYKKVTMCKMRNLIEVPYTREIINKMIHVEKDWIHLNFKEKEKFLGKMKPEVFDKITRKINKIDSPIEKKN